MKTKINTSFQKIFVLAIALSFLAAGCGGGGGASTSNKPVTLTVWMPFGDNESFQTLSQAYTQKHPNVQIVFSKRDINTYGSDLLNALAAGNGPDVFSIHNDWLPAYLDKVTPAPTTVFTLKDYKDTFVDVLTKDFTNDTKIYGTALSVDSLALYYNKDLLGSAGIATPPKTWAELSSDVQKLRRFDGKGYFTTSGVAMGTNSNVNRAVDILYLLMLQQRVVPFSDDGLQVTLDQNVQKNGNFYNPAEIALTYYTSFASPQSPNYTWNARSDYSIDAFANGRAAFLYSYSYTRATLLQKNSNLNFDVASVPQPNLNDPSVNLANYWGEVVSKQSKNSAMAWDFLKFITSKDSLDKYYAQVKEPSSRKDLIEIQAQDPDIGVFANANLTAKSFYKPDQQKVDDIFGKMVDNVILKGVTVTDAISQGVQQIQTITNQ